VQAIDWGSWDIPAPFFPYHYYTGFKLNYFIKLFAENEFQIDRIVRVGSIYSVIALYIWFIIQKISNVFSCEPASSLQDGDYIHDAYYIYINAS